MESVQKRLELYEQAKRLYKAGQSYGKVAKKLKIPARTVYDWIHGDKIPGRPSYSLTTKIQRRKLEDWELGWLAGIIDGEGSLMFIKAKRKELKQGFNWSVRIQVTNKDRRIINKARELWGNSGSIITSSGSRPNVHALRASSNVMRYILPKILNMLVSKRRQAELLLEALELLRVARRNSGRARDVRLEKIYQEMKKLNHGRV